MRRAEGTETGTVFLLFCIGTSVRADHFRLRIYSRLFFVGDFIGNCHFVGARATTAFNRLEPITAPRPERPAALPWLLMIQETSASFSPAGRCRSRGNLILGHQVSSVS